ncbi:DUF1007 family protein [Pseudotabrizicola sp. L79]|uniref:DUF1007 family protein n=1 Tax=Pseudotabrizicola sp. L79 TaxID=3118402 RepID=UPI002F927C61
MPYPCLSAAALATLTCLVAPGAALAHPHIFIDTSIEVVFTPTGQAGGFRITWAYDDLYSLAYLAENGFDPDFDGTLTEEELARLQGFDMEWDAGFLGDSYAFLGKTPLPLTGPTETTAGYQDGRLISTHLRPLAAPVDLAGNDLVLRVYDPSFYTAYTIAAQPVLTGRADCQAQVFEPDRENADARLQAAIAELAGTAEAEGEFPAIGDAYAEEMVVTCPAA